jgi:hypothetical protein
MLPPDFLPICNVIYFDTWHREISTLNLGMIPSISEKHFGESSDFIEALPLCSKAYKISKSGDF